jgi:hypothetical protein
VRVFFSVTDPDPELDGDPVFFGPQGSGSVIICTDPDPYLDLDSLHQQTKNYDELKCEISKLDLC